MGKLSNKFLGAFKNDDYDDEYDDEYYDDDYDMEEDRRQDRRGSKSNSLFNKFKSGVNRDYDNDYDDDYDDEPRREERRNTSSGRMQKEPAPRRGGGMGSEVCVIKPSSIDDSREITETLLDGKACIINFEGLHVEISQRIIDFISGSCFALDGNLQKISNYIFIATPNSVDISGDFQDILGAATADNSFDIAGFKSPLL